jgi:UDP-N-acetylglucosamine--N-acetylmuramyl-(pentapeptide) pyrophosphoryl-undecaprenol N-acetylglucosamine transferase
MRIAVAGGVTGGHIYPAVAVLQYFMKQFDSVEVLYFATPHGLENREIVRLFPSARIVKLETRGILRPYYSFRNLSILYKAARSFFVCKKELEEFKPDFSFITGGYVSVPVGWASQKLRIPIFLHEQNAIAGLANKLIGRRSERIFISFPESARDFKLRDAHRILHTGNPVRITEERDRCIFTTYGLNPNKKIVLVAGGSHGSDFINELMLQLYTKWKQKNNGIEFLHSCGDPAFLKKIGTFAFVKAIPFIQDMHCYIANADAMISRGGATTVAEIEYYGIPSLIIPWPGAAENHQLINAISLEKHGAAYYLEEKEATLEALEKKLSALLEKKGSQNMRWALKQLKPKTNPAKKIFREILASLDRLNRIPKNGKIQE